MNSLGGRQQLYSIDSCADRKRNVLRAVVSFAHRHHPGGDKLPPSQINVLHFPLTVGGVCLGKVLFLLSFHLIHVIPFQPLMSI